MAFPRPVPELQEIHTIALDFDGVFTDNKVWVDADGRETVRCDRADGFAFDLLRAFQRHGILDAQIFILSKERDPVVAARAKKLRLDCHHSVDDKLGFVVRYLEDRITTGNDPFRGLAFLGNDLPDLPLIRRAGFTAAPADAHPRVREAVDLVLAQPGGAGCVRAFVEQLLRIHEMTEEGLDELVSHC